MTNFKDKLVNFSNDTEAGSIDTPAMLFINSTKNNKFGQIYLFSKFGKAESNSLTLNSQITTHYTEDNCHINDHWALEPAQYTLTGLLGEVVFTPSKDWKNKAEKALFNYLKPLGILSPTFDSYTQSAINLTQHIEENYRKYQRIARKALRSIGIGTNYKTSNQQYVIAQLELLRNNRQLVSIYTPFKNMYDMAITNINVNQGNTKYSSNLEITFMQWRYKSSFSRTATRDEKSELARVQQAVTQQQGQAGTTNVNINDNSTLKNLIDGIKK